MRIFDLFKRSDSVGLHFFLMIFAATNLLTIGCSENKTQSDSLSKKASNANPSASPILRKLSSTDAIAAFEKANLEVVSPHPIESKNADKRKIVVDGKTVEVPEEIEGTEFSIPSAGKNMRGRVFSYENWKDAEESRSIYGGIANLTDVEGGSSEIKDSLYWNFNNKNLMVQISRKVPQKKAKLYLEALLSIK